VAVLSSVPAVKNALFDRLVARAGLISSELVVSYGIPVENPAEEYIAVGRVPEHEQRQIGAGPPPHTREENYVLQVLVSVLRDGAVENQQTCTERAYAIAAEIEDELADDPSINGAISVGYLAEVEGHELFEPTTDNRCQADILMRIRCRTIIGP
jgi:hypothetical protein